MVDPSRIEADLLQPPIEPPAPPRVHPLDRPEAAQSLAAENDRIRLAWAKLVWLMAFLGLLLAISYLVPYIAEHTQYAIKRGKQAPRSTTLPNST